MRQKHIVIVTPYYAPAWAYGGPPRVLSTLAEQLVREGLKVSVITTNSLGQTTSPTDKEVLNGVNVFRFPILNNTLAYKHKFFFVKNLLAQSQVLLDSADRVLFSDVRSFLAFSLFPYLKQKKIPYGVFLFGQVPRGEGFLLAHVKFVFDTWWVQRYLYGANWIFAQTEHEKSIVQSTFSVPSSRVFLSLLPILTKNKNRYNTKTFKEFYTIPQENKVLLFIGRLNKLKGVDILVSSLTPLLKKNKNISLVIVGRDDGVQAELIENIPSSLAQQIIFTGPLYEKDAQTAYAACDCFVFTPTFFEETSTAALEALSLGKPVITTEQADIPYLEKYGAGYVIPNDKKTILKYVQKVLAQSQKSSFSPRAIKLIRECYDVSKITQQLRADIEI